MGYMRCARTSSVDVDQNKLFYPPNFILFRATLSNRLKTLGVIIWIAKMVESKDSGHFETVEQNEVQLGGQNNLFRCTFARGILARPIQ